MIAVVIRSPEFHFRNLKTLPGRGRGLYWKVTDRIL